MNICRQVLSRSLRPAPRACRGYAKAAPKSQEKGPVVSSCPANTVLTGLAYLKDQPPIVALPDEEYPEWLWSVLSPKEFSEDQQGPGLEAEHRRLRQANREKIRMQNFMRTQ